MAKTALQKLNANQQPEITSLPAGIPWGVEGTSMVISTPREIDELMRQVSPGKLVTMTELRQALARRHQVEIACPLTSGIFARIAAEAACELEAMGQSEITPYWRTLKADGVLNEKYPGGIEGHRTRLEAEGWQVVGKGKTWRVQNFREHLAELK